MCCSAGEGAEKWHHRPSHLEELRARTLPLFTSMSLKTSAQCHIEAHKYCFFKFLMTSSCTPGGGWSCPRLSGGAAPCPCPSQDTDMAPAWATWGLNPSGTFITQRAHTNSIRYLIKCRGVEYQPLLPKANGVN